MIGAILFFSLFLIAYQVLRFSSFAFFSHTTRSDGLSRSFAIFPLIHSGSSDGLDRIDRDASTPSHSLLAFPLACRIAATVFVKENCIVQFGSVSEEAYCLPCRVLLLSKNHFTLQNGSFLST